MMQVHPEKPSENSFELLREHRVGSLNLNLIEFRHRVTGAQHFHFAADNPENVFMVAFRTVPVDSRGVAHILEHTSLCGSEKYPVRDPFFMMNRRSLNTFMNAFTSSDYTAYPFASQSRKDFDNLMDIYLDAVFFSRLDRLDFAQEGHRLEFETPEDKDSPLVYRGVVYNEMKGDTSSPVSVLYDTYKKYLFPTTTYHHNSGGDPEQIPDLSYQDLLSFYKTHYHPSNAIFMTYGDIPVEELQEKIERNALSRFERLDKTITVPAEKRYYAPVRVEESYAQETAGENQCNEVRDKSHIVIGWLLGTNTDLEEMLNAHLLADMLLDTSASPLRMALETTGLGTAVSPLCGLEESNHEMSFMCGIEGSNPDAADELEKLVLDTLAHVVRDGVPPDRLEAVLHQLELHQREVGGDGYPHGLQLMFTGLPAAIHGGDPFGLLDLDPVLEKLREDIKSPDFITSLIQKLLLDNPHRVRLTLKPDPNLARRRLDAEIAKLANIKNSLNDDMKMEIIEQSRLLKARQNKTDDPEILPKVGLADIPAEKKIPTAELLPLKNGARRTLYRVGTNGLVYQQLVTVLPEIPDQFVRLIPLYTNVLTEIGSGGRDYLETQHLQHSITGGLHAFSTIRTDLDNLRAARSFVTLSGKALGRNQRALTELLRETWESATFSESDRIRELIQQILARKESGLASNGHGHAMMAAGGRFSPVIHMNHRLSGLASIQWLRELELSIREDTALDKICIQLEKLHQLVSDSSSQFLLVSDEENMPELIASIDDQWQEKEKRDGVTPFVPDSCTDLTKQAWTTNTQVNFCARAYATVAETHEDSAALTVLGGVLTNGFLHRAIREQGGAYGGGAGHDSSNGVFRFYSYRDPRLDDTFSDFTASIQWLLAGDLEPDKVEEAVLGVISSIDAPGSPSGEARQAFHSELFGRTRLHINARRKAIMRVSVNDLLRVTERYLLDKQSSSAVVATPDFTSTGNRDEWVISAL
jgi:Zn-dependent M16 (insulinase) family peptidase